MGGGGTASHGVGMTRRAGSGRTPLKSAIRGLEMKKPAFLQVFSLFLARPERFERPTPWFVAKYSIQLSYGRSAF